MSADRRKRLRCAVYTRKSSEEGLEQASNSLDAQREACEAYIKSQTGEGWTLVRTHYDDGGVSGGTMERPALQQLLADIKTHKVDTVVVYKVDRLTRALADFAKIVEVFDAHSVSFVSVTRQFNTTTSMGRLTLNMLLSFAQFEREVTGERIRDKIVASKRKGLWMGGFVPLGYEPKDRTLAINEAEAETVRTIFQLYLEHGTVRRVKEAADRRGLKTKIRRSKDGRVSGGRPLSRGALYKLLGNPLYIGRIPHRDESYEGQHPAIIDAEIWDAVQAKLASNTKARRSNSNASDPSLLAGLLYDDQGNRLTPTHAVKNGRRYRYYVLRDLKQETGNDASGISIPAQEIESLVLAGIRDWLKNASNALDHFAEQSMQARDQRRLLAAAERQADCLSCIDDGTRTFIRTAVRYIAVCDEKIRIDVSRSVLRAMLLQNRSSNGADANEHLTDQDNLFITIYVAAQLKRCGGEMRLIIPADGQSMSEPRSNPALIQILLRAHDWKDQLLSGRAHSIRAIADAEGRNERFVGHRLRLAFLAPDITEAILEGRQPPDLDIGRLLQGIPRDWQEQRRRFGFPTRA